MVRVGDLLTLCAYWHDKVWWWEAVHLLYIFLSLVCLHDLFFILLTLWKHKPFLGLPVQNCTNCCCHFIAEGLIGQSFLCLVWLNHTASIHFSDYPPPSLFLLNTKEDESILSSTEAAAVFFYISLLPPESCKSPINVTVCEIWLTTKEAWVCQRGSSLGPGG